MMTTCSFTRLERIDGTAIRALGVTRTGYIKVNLGMAAINFHMRFGAGAVDTALRVQV